MLFNGDFSEISLLYPNLVKKGIKKNIMQSIELIINFEVITSKNKDRCKNVKNYKRNTKDPLRKVTALFEVAKTMIIVPRDI